VIQLPYAISLMTKPLRPRFRNSMKPNVPLAVRTPYQCLRQATDFTAIAYFTATYFSWPRKFTVGFGWRRKRGIAARENA
jgi:hypothetical protein